MDDSNTTLCWSLLKPINTLSGNSSATCSLLLFCLWSPKLFPQLPIMFSWCTLGDNFVLITNPGRKRFDVTYSPLLKMFRNPYNNFIHLHWNWFMSLPSKLMHCHHICIQFLMENLTIWANGLYWFQAVSTVKDSLLMYYVVALTSWRKKDNTLLH